MKTIPAQYAANGWNYKLVQRSETAAIYSQSRHTDLPVGGQAAAFEVFKIRFRKAEQTPKFQVEGGEYLPRNEEWGQTAWTCPTLERAKAVFAEIMAGIRPRKQGNGLPASR